MNSIFLPHAKAPAAALEQRLATPTKNPSDNSNIEGRGVSEITDTTASLPVSPAKPVQPLQGATPDSVVRARAIPDPAPFITPPKLDLPDPLPTAPILKGVAD